MKSLNEFNSDCQARISRIFPLAVISKITNIFHFKNLGSRGIICTEFQY